MLRDGSYDTARYDVLSRRLYLGATFAVRAPVLPCGPLFLGGAIAMLSWLPALAINAQSGLRRWSNLPIGEDFRGGPKVNAQFSCARYLP